MKHTDIITFVINIAVAQLVEALRYKSEGSIPDGVIGKILLT